MSVQAYDDVILGGGKGGKSLAMALANAGHRVALIEQGQIGGTCINVACTPNSAGLGLDAAGVQVDKRGAITVDDYLQTTAENVYALGDCNGGPLFRSWAARCSATRAVR